MLKFRGNAEVHRRNADVHRENAEVHRKDADVHNINADVHKLIASVAETEKDKHPASRTPHRTLHPAQASRPAGVLRICLNASIKKSPPKGWRALYDFRRLVYYPKQGHALVEAHGRDLGLGIALPCQ